MMQPLSSTKRNTYFILFSLLFVVVIPFLILYSEGYRFGKTFSVVKTGGIYLYSDIADTTVYIDGTLKKETGLFLRNTFIQNLKPDTYNISVEKAGYRNWEKQFEVFENKVTDAKVFMIKQELASSTIPRLIPTASSTVAVATTAKMIVNPDYTELEKLFAIATTTATSSSIRLPISQSQNVSTTSTTTEVEIDPRRIKPSFKESSDTYSWLENGDVYINWVGPYERTPFYFCNQGDCVDETIVSIDEEILEYSWLAGSVEGMVLRTNSGIYVTEVDFRTKANVHKIYEGKVDAIRVANTGNIVIRTKDSFITFDLD